MSNPPKEKKGPWDPKRDAEYLVKAMGSDPSNKEKVLLEIFSTRSRKHIQEIRRKFVDMYDKSLESWISANTSGNFEKTLLAFCDERAELKCKYLNRATAEENAGQDIIIQILCPASTRELKRLNVVYQRLYGSDLNSLIDSDWSDDLRLLMTELVKADRPFEGTSENKAWEEAQILAAQSKGNAGFHLKSFIEALTQRSQEQTHLVFRHFEQLAGVPFESAFRNEMSGEFRQATRAMIRPPQEYFALMIHEIIKAGPHHSQLIRLVSTLKKSQLKSVNQTYLKQYHRTLHSVLRTAIMEGSYQNLVLDLIPPVV